MKISTLLSSALVPIALTAAAVGAATALGALTPVGATKAAAPNALGDGPMIALPGFVEMLPIIAILVLLFGARKLPELARAMGSSVTQFRRGLESTDDESKAIDGQEEEK